MHLQMLQIHHKYPRDCIIATCWMDMPFDTTVAPTSARFVPIKMTGHKKDHFTVILSAKADGTKIKLFVVFKEKGNRLIKDLQHISGIVV